MATFHRLCAAGALAASATGTAATAYAVTAPPGLGLRTYISEAGIPTYPHATAFRTGILTLAAALTLLALALLNPALRDPGLRVLARRAPAGRRLVTGLLLASAGFATGGGTVPCSDGCPLPPYEITTAADLVHATASILAVAAAVFAMAALALPGPDRFLRALSLGGAAIAFPLSAAVGLAMLSVGRGAAIGILERALLTVIAAWLLLTATRLTLPTPPAPTLTAHRHATAQRARGGGWG